MENREWRIENREWRTSLTEKEGNVEPYQKIVVAIIVTWLFLLPTGSFAGEADVLGVKITRQENGTYSFSVTVRHDDEGWDHYADRWEITELKGNTLGTRVLLHPHVGEQPFTRGLSGVEDMM